MDRIDHRARVDARPFLIGVFVPTTSGGWTISRALWEKRQHQWRWPFLEGLARRADALDLDYLFLPMAYPLAGGFGTRDDFRFREFRMESIATAAALTAVTRRIFVCPTVHILYHLHPVWLAQHAVTVDEIGGGRLGFNLVAGMSAAEIELLDAPRIPHDERYVAAGEFTTILKRAWTATEPFDAAGRYFRSKRAWVSPKPVQRPHPVLINAGLSEAGREFAASLCDWSFVNPPSVTDLEPTRQLCADLKGRAARHGKTLRLLTQGLIFARDTDAEARAFYDWVIAQADDSAIAAWQDASRRAVAAGLSQDTTRFAGDRARGEGRVFVSGLPIVGSPRTVVDRILALRAAGIDGIHLGFLDYDEIDTFGATILPLLHAAGLR